LITRNLNQQTPILRPINRLVGGFNPPEKYESKWESSPGRSENKKYLKPLVGPVFCLLRKKFPEVLQDGESEMQSLCQLVSSTFHTGDNTVVSARMSGLSGAGPKVSQKVESIAVSIRSLKKVVGSVIPVYNQPIGKDYKWYI